MNLCCYFSTARCVPDHNWNCMSSRDFRDAWMDAIAIFACCRVPDRCAVKP